MHLCECNRLGGIRAYLELASGVLGWCVGKAVLGGFGFGDVVLQVVFLQMIFDRCLDWISVIRVYGRVSWHFHEATRLGRAG